MPDDTHPPDPTNRDDPPEDPMRRLGPLYGPQTTHQWEGLTERGLRRGADAVLAAAVSTARLGATAGPAASAGTGADVGAGGDNASGEIDGGGVPVAELQRRRPRRSRPRRTFGALGLAALLGVGGYAALAVQGSGGGADSPAAAVRQLADAIDHEDALAAVAVLAPDEVRTLRATVSKAQHQAADTKLVASASAPLAGIDLSVRDLTTTVTSLGSGVAKVDIRGTLGAKVDRDKFAEILRGATGGHGTGEASYDLANLRVGGLNPFLVTVERDGGWYVSPVYTAFEYLRASAGLPAADFGSADASKLGADSPEAAATELIRAIGAGDWTKVASLAPPKELPLYEYRVAFAQLMRHNGQFAVDKVASTPHVDGSDATIDVTASGTYRATDYTGAHVTGHWNLEGGCITTSTTSATTPRGPNDAFGWCLTEHGTFPYGLTGRLDHTGPTTVHAVQESGRWFVSPVGTALGYLDTWISHVDRGVIAAWFNAPLESPVIGPITLDHAVASRSDGQSNAAGIFREFDHYTVHVDGPTDVVVDARLDRYGYSSLMFGVRLFGPDGTPLQPDATYTKYHLPAAGTYDVTMSEFGTPYRVTVWRADHAPADVPKGAPGCNPTPSGGEECSISGTTGGSMTTVPVPTRTPTTVEAGSSSTPTSVARGTTAGK